MCDSTFRSYLKKDYSFKRGQNYNVKKNWDKQLKDRFNYALDYL